MASMLSVAIFILGTSSRWFAAAHGAEMGVFREERRIRLPGPTYSVAWSPDGSRLAVLTPPYLRVFSTERWEQTDMQQILHRLYTGKSLAFTSEDAVLLGGGGESSANGPVNRYALTVQNIGDPPRQAFIPEPSENEHYRPQDTFSFSPVSQRLTALDVAGSAIYIYNMEDRSLQHIVAARSTDSPLPAYMRSPAAPAIIMDGYSALATSPDGETVIACTRHGTVYSISALDGMIDGVVPGFGDGVGCTAVSFDADGRYLAIGRRSLYFVPPRQPPLVDGLTGRSRLREEDYSEPVKIFDARTHEIVAAMADFHGNIQDIAAIPGTHGFIVADGDTLACVGYDATTRSFSIEQRFGGQSFKIAVSGRGRVASVQGTDVVIYERAEARR